MAGEEVREIKPKLGAVVKDVAKRVAKGENPVKAVRAAVKAARKPKPVKVKGVVVGHIKQDADEFAPDLGKELIDSQEQNEMLRTEITALRATDRAAEITKLVSSYRALEGRLRGAMKTANEAEKTASYGTAKLKAIRVLLKVERDRDIIPALKAVLK